MIARYGCGIWKLAKTVRTLEGHTGSVFSVAVTPDGRLALSGSDDRTLRLWDLESGKTIHILQGHRSAVKRIAVAPDGRSVVSTSDDRTLRLWDLHRGRMIRTLEGHTDSVRGVAVTPDGRLALSGSRDQTLRLWDLKSGNEIGIFTADSIMDVLALAPDGCTIIAGDELGRVHFLEIVEADLTKPAIGNKKFHLLHREEQARSESDS
jgi:WD40 repeat protein